MTEDDGSIDSTEVRKLFPATDQWTYMNVAVRGLLSTRVREAVDAYIDSHQFGSWEKQAEFAMIERTRESFAKLINADPDEIAFTKNASLWVSMTTPTRFERTRSSPAVPMSSRQITLPSTYNAFSGISLISDALTTFG